MKAIFNGKVMKQLLQKGIIIFLQAQWKKAI